MSRPRDSMVEVSLAELLADPIIQALMRADGVTDAEIVALHDWFRGAAPRRLGEKLTSALLAGSLVTGLALPIA